MNVPTHILGRLGVDRDTAIRIAEELTFNFGPDGWTTREFASRLHDEGAEIDGDIRSSELREVELWARRETGADMDGDDND